MCNLSGVRSKDPRRKWLSLASLGLCYIAVLVIVRDLFQKAFSVCNTAHMCYCLPLLRGALYPS
jgi:hypothetical protein